MPTTVQLSTRSTDTPSSILTTLNVQPAGKIKRYGINILLSDVGRVAPAGVTRTQVCYPPTYKMDPKWCIAPFFICTLNGVTPAKHKPKWRILFQNGVRSI